MQRKILVEGRAYGPAEVIELRGRSAALDDLADFLDEWFSESLTVQVQTSGSTGVPKVMHVQRKNAARIPQGSLCSGKGGQGRWHFLAGDTSPPAGALFWE